MNRTEIKATIKTVAAAGGATARHLFLALAMLRGRPYRTLELTVREHHEPSPTAIAKLLECEPDTVKAWLGTPASEAVVAQAAAARASFLEAKALRAKAYGADQAGQRIAAE